MPYAVVCEWTWWQKTSPAVSVGISDRKWEAENVTSSFCRHELGYRKGHLNEQGYRKDHLNEQGYRKDHLHEQGYRKDHLNELGYRKDHLNEQVTEKIT